MGPSRDKGSKGFAAKLLPIIPLNIKVETKINIDGKPCHTLVNFGATFSTWNYTLRVKVSKLGASDEVHR